MRPPASTATRGVKSSARQSDPASTIVPAPLHWGSGEDMPTELEIPPSKRAENAKPREGHAVISTFDLFSIGVGPSSSHTVGPMRAAKIFTYSLPPAMHDKIAHLKVSLHGSLAATGMGHMTPHAVLLGMMGEDPETVEVGRLSRVMDEVRAVGQIDLGLDGGHKRVKFDLEKDLTWHLNPLPSHPNGMVFTVFDDEGNMLATNEYFSIGGGFVVNRETQMDENMYYMQTRPKDAKDSRRHVDDEGDAEGGAGVLPSPSAEATDVLQKTDADVPESKGQPRDHKPRLLFASAEELYAICKEHNLTIAQVVWENERAFRSDAEIASGLLQLWQVMDECIRNGVTSTDKTLPGGLEVRRRAPGLYKRLQQGFYPAMAIPKPGGSDETALTKGEQRIGRTDHPLQLIPRHTRPVFPGIEYLSCMAIAVNEVNASGGRVVTAPTNGYLVEYHSQQPERDVMTFLLTAAAIGMLFKRGATISAAEGGCMAEVGVACSMAAPRRDSRRRSAQSPPSSSRLPRLALSISE
ncbi:hypothetical protein A1Q1_01641 [Trichosporon asahii var. asahii CBS 2479]|uniref:L-serine ammonia-lyase n=1 Tax=Trichosporon asahii var. asahii (strain ATCC 90039 / CBS 2479 / JCM 2466 / KCTC 7840 / NBRC 103889/ NCYC 2677 / UAMH 7654) TaxID=1186058 RepID=J5T583_TRIAS|nr:hypothetical protein A1Q1_01641 [Trichosporon asahii var. asahii CBS 2479]EJT49241.1 hypothetical protein A1Q1_01641 [Trichosporon asahii var. asahii CBS 2479]